MKKKTEHWQVCNHFGKGKDMVVVMQCEETYEVQHIKNGKVIKSYIPTK